MCIRDRDGVIKTELSADMYEVPNENVIDLDFSEVDEDTGEVQEGENA